MSSMDALNKINLITILICLAALIPIIKGITNRFSREEMYNSLFGVFTLGMSLFAIALSLFIVVDLTMSSWFQADLEKVQSMLNINVSYSAEFYIIVEIVLALIIYSVLRFITLLIEEPLRKFSFFLWGRISKANKFLRSILGFLVELPGAVVRVLLLVFLISFFSGIYPLNPIAKAAGKSEVYNLINSYAVDPVVKGNVGKSLPDYLKKYTETIYNGAGTDKAVNVYNEIQHVGYLRFQYESKSNEEIDSTAKKIVGSTKNEKQKAYLLYQWIGKNISYDWDKYNDIINGTDYMDKFGAIPAFNSKKGICEDYADLYAAMAKAVGLKVRVIVGQGYSGGSWGGHAWNEVYISSEKKWIPLDTTWARAGNYFNNKNFNKDHKFEAIAGEW